MFGNKKGGCSLLSSKCVKVVSELCGITVCEDDTLDDVLKKIANKIHSLEKTLDPSKYDLSELLPENASYPKTFKEFLDLLIVYIKQNSSEQSTNSPSVQVAPCDYNSLGNNPISSETYIEYLANKVCSIEQTISSQNQQLGDLLDKINILQQQINSLL